jgi:hypothetical protein
MKRSFHGGHSLHGATMDMRKKPRASVGLGGGANSALGLGSNKRAMMVPRRRSAAPQQPSETTHAMVRQEKAPHERTRTGQRRARAGGQEIARQRQCRIVPSLNANGRPEGRPLALHRSTSLRRSGDLKQRLQDGWSLLMLVEGAQLHREQRSGP